LNTKEEWLLVHPEELKAKFRIFWQDKPKRDKTLLIVFCVILLLTITYRLLKSEPKPPEGTLKAVYCLNCGNKDVIRVKDINNPKYKCKKCGGRLAITWKCRDCGFEFPFKQGKVNKEGLSRSELFMKLDQLRKCPKCGSLRTHALSPKTFKKRQERDQRLKEKK
jgi:predicted RNA-binding Zn-ribbon protein involved in translation (DUF1610 family)